MKTVDLSHLFPSHVALRAHVAALGFVSALLAVGLGVAGTGFSWEPAAKDHDDVALWAETMDPTTLAERERVLVTEQHRLRRDLARNAPMGRYIVVDRTHNRLLVKDGDNVLLMAVCSAGSGVVLQEGRQGREWVFDTPRGRFEVRSKTRNPVWRKPDWAFIEAGEPIPAETAPERFEYGALGEYALDLGDGYLIHGTLYERLLGRSVTHGCIRLGADDLRQVYRLAAVGTPVLIF